MSLRLQPVTLRQANAYVFKYHRHSKPVRGQKWSVGVTREEPIGLGARRQSIRVLCGVAIAGRPVARELDDGLTVEILRVCTDGARNACTKLYGACCRAGEGMGYVLAITYTLASEGGASLRAAGFRPVAEVKDRQWDCQSRPREERDLIGDKVRWERAL